MKQKIFNIIQIGDKSGILDYHRADIREIAELFVDKQYAGKTAEELEETEQFNVYLLLRDGLSVLPQKDLILKQNDIIIIRGHEQ